MATENYKRTVAGSVGAGMGAIFNGSGRTYYIIEHKTSSKYHQAGESQKIIIDEIMLGRDSSCQVRFDESFSTVSRKHAAIVKEGTNYKLLHLSQSNQTFVNGQPVSGEYYLQSGDEIQLSSQGPRLGFIVPQGRQALTSSIGLTERMNLFRQQALTPYKRALWAMAVLLLLVIAGFGAWNWKLSQDNAQLQKEMSTLIAKTDSLQSLRSELESQLAADPDNQEVKEKLANVNNEIRTTQQRVVVIRKTLSSSGYSAPAGGNDEEEAENEVAGNDNDVVANDVVEEPAKSTASSGAAANDIASYTDCVYSLKVDNIKVSFNGVDVKHGIANPGVVGNGFLIDNGTFVTARQNVQPWIYSGVLSDGEWRRKLAEFFACGCDIEIQYSAYSSTGSANKITFNSRDFKHPSDYTTTELEITKQTLEILKDFKINIVKKRAVYKQFAANSACYAVIRGLANTGIPTSSAPLEGGQTVKVAGHAGQTDVHNLTSFTYMTSTTTDHDRRNGTINLQDGNNNSGYLGSPAFIQTDGGYKVVGVYVGNMFGQPRIVPISRCR